MSNNTEMKSISFEVPVVESTTAPENIMKKIKENEEKIVMKRSLSKEDIDAKLETAYSRRKSLEAEIVTRCATSVAHAKSISERQREGKTVTKEELEAKLIAAAEKKEEQIMSRKSKLEEHAKIVEARKEGAHDFRSEMTQRDIEQQLQAAEARRKAMEEEAVARLAERHRKVEQVKEQNANPNSGLLSTLTNKLELAESRRKELEEAKLAHLARMQEHAEEVRKRKTATSA